MSAQEMPEWLIDYLEDNTGFYCAESDEGSCIRQTERSEAVIDFYNFISKPENLAKIPEVEKFINFAKIYSEFTNIELNILKPFEVESSANVVKITSLTKGSKNEG